MKRKLPMIDIGGKGVYIRLLGRREKGPQKIKNQRKWNACKELSSPSSIEVMRSKAHISCICWLLDFERCSSAMMSFSCSRCREIT